jgi:hypothetical protein
MKYFTSDMDLAAAKKSYWSLMQANHPDHGGSEEVCKDINKQFEDYCSGKIKDAFNEAGDDKTKNADAQAFADILKAVMRFNCRVEIIGYWVYCFESFGVKDQLAALGFFFSGKHKAWIYNGGKKLRIHTRNTTDDNRAKFGSQVMKEKEESERLDK